VPLPIEKFRELEQRKGETVKKQIFLSQKCRILPNWMTNKYGKCKRLACQFRGKPGCVER